MNCFAVEEGGVLLSTVTVRVVPLLIVFTVVTSEESEDQLTKSEETSTV
jgi:hypothetical protein